MNIHITNLNLNLIEVDLQRLFTPYGEVKTIELVRDKLNNRSRGKAYIDMPIEAEGRKATMNLHGFQFAGKTIIVIEVPYNTEQNDRPTKSLL
jgi:RNA recognition motif-containing protein